MNLLKEYGIKIPNGAVATTASQVQIIARKLRKFIMLD